MFALRIRIDRGWPTNFCACQFSGEVCQIRSAMARSFIRSWNELYRLVGYAEADDPESARAAIVTNFVSSHQNPHNLHGYFLVNINLHIYLSAVSIPNFGDVTHRLATILQPDAMASLSIEVLQIPARQVPREPGSLPSIPAPVQRRVLVYARPENTRRV